MFDSRAQIFAVPVLLHYNFLMTYMTKDYPGLKKFLNVEQLSGQVKSSRAVRTANNQCGEQTANSETAG